jgi:hypothetical protein
MYKEMLLFFYGLFLNLLLFGIQVYYSTKTTKKIIGTMEKGEKIVEIGDRYKRVLLKNAKVELEQAKKDVQEYSDSMIEEYQGIVKMSKDYYWCIVIVMVTLTIFNFFQFSTLAFLINFVLHIVLYHLISSSTKENITISLQKEMLFKLNTISLIKFYDYLIKESETLINDPEKLKIFLKEQEEKRKLMNLNENGVGK